MTFLGGLLRFFSTLPFVRDAVSLNAQYWMGVVAQAITGIGNPLGNSIPTKVRYEKIEFPPLGRCGIFCGCFCCYQAVAVDLVAVVAVIAVVVC